MTPYYIPPPDQMTRDDGSVNFGYGQSQQFNAQPYLQAAGGAVAGVSSGLSHQGYSLNPGGILQSGVQGFMAGGPIGAAVGIVGNAVGQTIAAHRNIKNIDASVDAVSHDAYGRPVYQGARVSELAGELPELQKAAKWDNLGGGLFNNGLLGIRGRALRKMREIKKNIGQAQASFNQAEVNYRSRRAQLQDYVNRQRTNFDNLYRFG